jgi:hypothetical protein
MAREPQIIEEGLTLGVALEMQAAQRAYTPLPADHPFYSVIGQVSSEWAHLEHALDLTLWDLGDIEPISGSCLTAQIMGVSARLRELLQKSYGVTEKRNRIVHPRHLLQPAVNRGACTKK